MAELAKPGDYFIGIAEFFGSLAPGTVLVALLWRLGAVPGFSNQPRDLLGFEGTAILAALIIGGYLAGNVVSVFGAKLDLSYDAVRKRLYPPERDNAYPAAKRLCEDELGDQASAMNAFQWARTVLAIEHRDAFDEVSRFEAASKLFRSMVIVSLAVALTAAAQEHVAAALAALFAAALSYWPYVDRRYKSTETAYRLVIVLRSRRPK